MLDVLTCFTIAIMVLKHLNPVIFQPGTILSLR